MHPDLYVPKGEHYLLSSDIVAYIRAKQGVYATDSSVMVETLRARESVRGSVLVRSLYINPGIDGGNPESGVLGRGEACAMLHHVDVQNLSLRSHFALSHSRRLIRSPHRRGLEGSRQAGRRQGLKLEGGIKRPGKGDKE